MCPQQDLERKTEIDHQSNSYSVGSICSVSRIPKHSGLVPYGIVITEPWNLKIVNYTISKTKHDWIWQVRASPDRCHMN